MTTWPFKDSLKVWRVLYLERKLREEEEARERELEEEKRRNSFWNKFSRKVKEFGKTIMSEDEE